MELFYDKEKEREKLRKNRHVIVVPLDVVILINIVAVFLIAVAFSLGVEKGKKTALHYNKNIDTAKKANIELPPPEISKVTAQKTPRKLTGDLTTKEEGRYIIQVASYLKEDIALKEKEHLRKEGFSAQLSKKGKYTVLFVGKFISKKEAQRIKTLLKKRYEDCFIRRM